MPRTTILLEDRLESRLRNKAKTERKTITELIQHYIRQGLNQAKPQSSAPKLNIASYSMGKALADPADRQEIWNILDQEKSSLY